MKYAYNKLTGEFVDSEDSAMKLGLGYNPANLDRLGLTPDDVVIVESNKKDSPWDQKLVNGKLVPDTKKLEAKAAAEQEEADAIAAKEAARASAVTKLAALGLTTEEMAALFGRVE